MKEDRKEDKNDPSSTKRTGKKRVINDTDSNLAKLAFPILLPPVFSNLKCSKIKNFVLFF